MTGLIDSSGFEQESKRRAEDFTRKRKLPFREPVRFMLTMTKTSVRNALEDFMAKVRKDIPVTQQAFSRARKKIRREAFAQTPAAAVKGSYEDGYKKWNNRFRLMAADGSSLQLPHPRELREYFGTEENERNEAAKAPLLYDLENDLTAAAEPERADRSLRSGISGSRPGWKVSNGDMRN